MNTQNIKNIVDDDDFKEVIQSIIDSQVKRILNSTPDQSEEREQAYQRIACVNELIAALESIAVTGEIKDKRWNIL
jgi:hypothetical protein